MFKLYTLLFVLLAFGGSLTAQRRVINGFLKDSLTHYPVAGKITNLTSKTSITADSEGFFRLEAGPNDFIFVVAPSYKYDTLSYSMLFTDTITLFLAPAAVVLPNVIVTSKYTRYQMDSMQRRTEFDQDRGTVFSAVDKSHGPGFGATINLDKFFKKKYRNKKKEEEVFDRLERNSYVSYRFSPPLVSMYTGLKGDSLQNFILRYSPSYEWMRQHPTNEDVLYYINDKLKLSRVPAKQ